MKWREWTITDRILTVLSAEVRHTLTAVVIVSVHTHTSVTTRVRLTLVYVHFTSGTQSERASSVWLLSAHLIMRSHLCPLKPGLQVQSGPPDPSLQTPPCSHCKSTSHRRGGNRHLTEETHLLYHISSILNTSKQGSFLFIRINMTDTFTSIWFRKLFK